MTEVSTTRPEKKSHEADPSLVDIVLQNKGKIGLITAVGTVSGFFNHKHGLEAMIMAALNQAGYSTISTIVLLKIYDFLAERVKTIPGELIPIIVPILVTILANLGIHEIRGTAEPILSTLPTAVLATIGFPIWHIRRRIGEISDCIKKVDIKL